MTNMDSDDTQPDKYKNAKWKEVNRGGSSIVDIKPVFSSDSKRILVASDTNIKVFNVTGGELLEELVEHKQKIIGVCLHPEDRRTYLSCDEGGTIVHWRLNPTKKLKIIKLPILKKGKMTSFLPGPGFGIIVSVLKTNSEEDGCLYLVKSPLQDRIGINLLASGIKPGCNKVALSKCGEYCVAIKDTRFYVRNLLNSNKQARHKLGNVWLHCVALHPNDQVAATGDNLGRVIIWQNIFNMYPVKTILHWHTMPVSDLAFSHLGNEVYSGGRESVIVKWQLTEGRRYFIPRIGMPICFVAADSTNSYVAASQVDNSITIADGREWSRLGVIQGFSANMHDDSPFPCGLNVCPTSNCIITNANCGHLQFYNITQERQIHQFDVTNRNYITEERNCKIPNIDVIHVGVSSHGNWLVTFESDCLSNVNAMSHDCRLKFWWFNPKEQSWHLNTSVEMPHNMVLTGLDVQPTSSPDDHPLCVTYSCDGRFKIWKIVDDTDIYRENVCWNCVCSGEYRGLPLQTAKFTNDGTMLAVAYGSTLTMWLPDTCQMKGSLSQPYITEPITQIVFGIGEGNLQYVITRSNNWLCCWDLLTCCLCWRVFISCTLLVIEPSSGIIAGFTTLRDVFVFKPNKCDPILWLKEAVSFPVTSAVFVPSKGKKDEKTFLDTPSLLCYLNTERRTINTLDMIEDVDEEMEIDQDGRRKLKKSSHKRNYSIEEDEDEVDHYIDDGVRNQNILTIKPKSRKKEKLKTLELKEVSTDNATDKFMSKFLSELTVHHMDTFGSLAADFCNLVIPDQQIKQPVQITPVTTESLQDATTSLKKNKPDVKLSKISKNYMDDIVTDLL